MQERSGTADTWGVTAPRNCRACGAPLAGDVRWCLRCYEPVRELSPRPPQLPPLPAVREPSPEPRTSRFRAGPTTLGPVGRILATLVVALFAPWRGLVGFDGALGPLMLWYLLGYTMIAVLLLRHIWRREPAVDPGRPGPFARLGQRFPSLRRRVPPVVVAGALGLLGLAALAAAWANLDVAGRYYLVAAGVAGGAGAFLVLWNDL
ncbi:MAG: hypothetical protein KatS3mg014_2214 [Actinomycetota bacterium]|nr:MAG: hypothetical protein KatS3mg014_2214 [Actinomycetota bacterium]